MLNEPCWVTPDGVIRLNQLALQDTGEPHLLQSADLTRFRRTLEEASRMPSGSIPQEELGFLNDLGNVMDYVVKLELEVVELKSKVDSQPAEPQE